MPHDLSVAVENRCLICKLDDPGLSALGISRKRRRIIHPNFIGLPVCDNFDEECRHIGERLGFYVFAWRPRRCRNGRLRWLTWLERHEDGSYTLGDRAH